MPFPQTIGEDMTVAVWQVNLQIQDCLSQQLSVHCGRPPVYLAALGRHLALTSQEPNSGTYNLMHFNLPKQSQTGGRPGEGHSDHFTGHIDSSVCVPTGWIVYGAWCCVSCVSECSCSCRIVCVY